MIQNQAVAGLAPLGNFCDIAWCPVTSTHIAGAVCHWVKSDQVALLKIPKVPDWHPMVSVT